MARAVAVRQHTTVARRVGVGGAAVVTAADGSIPLHAGSIVFGALPLGAVIVSVLGPGVSFSEAGKVLLPVSPM